MKLKKLAPFAIVMMIVVVALTIRFPIALTHAQHHDNLTVTHTPPGSKTVAALVINASIVKDAKYMGNKAFQPNPIYLAVGGTVMWINHDSDMHTITSGLGPNDLNLGKQFDSGFLAQGQVFKHTFKSAGDFSYFCVPHPTMLGKVIVK